VIEGMTLRDWFAGQALSGIATLIGHDNQNSRSISEYAYKIADAMIEKKGKEPDNILHSKIRYKLARQIKELKELKNQTHS
jgi:hypothetical protein